MPRRESCSGLAQTNVSVAVCSFVSLCSGDYSDGALVLIGRFRPTLKAVGRRLVVVQPFVRVFGNSTLDGRRPDRARCIWREVRANQYDAKRAPRLGQRRNGSVGLDATGYGPAVWDAICSTQPRRARFFQAKVWRAPFAFPTALNTDLPMCRGPNAFLTALSAYPCVCAVIDFVINLLRSPRPPL